MKNTIYTKKSHFDQFYTNPEIAKQCYQEVINLYSEDIFDLFIEPSAGQGAFYQLFPQDKKIGIDLDPKCAGVIKQDFFDFSISSNQKIVAIGNPPFGKNSSLAVKFFNHAAEFSTIIAFIVPKTFKKISIHNRLNLNFKLKLEIDIPKNSFLLNNQPYDVPCCFQIWERSARKRKIIKVSLENEYFDFVSKTQADFAVRRVGGRTGKATNQVSTCSETSHYFLKSKNKAPISQLIKYINSINFTKTITATAGVKSLSKAEFIKAFLKKIKNEQ